MNKILAVVEVDTKLIDVDEDNMREIGNNVKSQIEGWLLGPYNNALSIVVNKGIKINIHQIRDESQPKLVEVKVNYVEKTDKLN